MTNIDACPLCGAEEDIDPGLLLLARELLRAVINADPLEPETLEEVMPITGACNLLDRYGDAFDMATVQLVYRMLPWLLEYEIP